MRNIQFPAQRCIGSHDNCVDYDKIIISDNMIRIGEAVCRVRNQENIRPKTVIQTDISDLIYILYGNINRVSVCHEDFCDAKQGERSTGDRKLMAYQENSAVLFFNIPACS